ncbi:MAG TPA: TldD/PmbA family protein [Thermodesulfovibrionales bacterium]|nr:TldD/PmbA family protein [Thermodesulfovibrionales bacterium]
MLDTDLLASLLKEVLARGGDYADVFVESRKVTSIQLEDGRLEKIISGIDSGAGMRLISGGKTAYGFSNDLSRDSLIRLATDLSGSFSRKTGTCVLDMTKRNPTFDSSITIRPDLVPMERKIRLVKSANTAARSLDDHIRQVTVTYRDFAQKVQVATSDGTIAGDERIQTVAAVQVVAAETGEIQTGYEAAGGNIGFELFDSVSVEDMAQKASKRAIMMLKAGKAPGGRMPIVISSEAGGTMIHEAIGHGLEADLAQQGLSIYSQKLGQEVASRLVTVIDDSTLPNKRGSFRFDDEGIPSQRTVLVDRGMLVGYLYDRLAAMRDSVKPTGNGRRESYRHRPIPRMTNTFLAPGDSSPDDILRSTPKGLFVRKMGGGQVNTVTGDFVFDVQEGYMIENGKIGEAVRGATLTGNGQEVLRSIDMVASDLGFSIGTCGKDAQGVPVSDAMPTIRVKEMVVGGGVAM